MMHVAHSKTSSSSNAVRKSVQKVYYRGPRVPYSENKEYHAGTQSLDLHFLLKQQPGKPGLKTHVRKLPNIKLLETIMKVDGTTCLVLWYSDFMVIQRDQFRTLSHDSSSRECTHLSSHPSLSCHASTIFHRSLHITTSHRLFPRPYSTGSVGRPKVPGVGPSCRPRGSVALGRCRANRPCLPSLQWQRYASPGGGSRSGFDQMIQF